MLNFTPKFPTSSLQWHRKGVVVSSLYIVSAAPSSSREDPHTLPLIQHFPLMGDRPPPTFPTFHVLQFLTNYSRMGPFFPWGLLGTDCFSNGSQTLPANLQPGSSPWSHRSYQKCQLLMGPHEQQA